MIHGIAIVTIVYVLMNLAMLHALLPDAKGKLSKRLH
mgnify:CR=1 FL=1